MRWKFLSLLCILMGLGVAIVPVSAQSETVITLGVWEFMRGYPIEEVLAEFEAQNPGIRAQVVYIPFEEAFLPPPAEDLEDHLEASHNLAEAADVIMVDQSNLSPLSTRAGDFLDLAPLASADSSLNPANFVPATWESFRWDNGLWALPAKFEPFMLVYDPDAFDAAGLTYPNASWTIDDLANAARALAQTDSSGAVTQPGFVLNGFGAMLLRSLVGSMTDPAAFPSVPRFSDPAIQNVFETYVELMDEGVIASAPTDMSNPDAVPMQINGAYALTPFMIDGSTPPRREAATLPGGGIGITVNGYAISAGTAYPQAAYALAKFLTENPRALDLVFATNAARTDVDLSSSASSGGPGVASVTMGGGSVSVSGMSFPPEIQAKVDALLPSAFSASELRFESYLTMALNSLLSGQTDAATALQNAELQAVADLQAAADSRGAQPIIVATPIPEVVLAPGEIVLKFGAGFAAQTGEWERLLREFTALDPEVGDIAIDTDFGDIEGYAERNDCFYLNYNAVPGADLSLLLPLDPLTSTDPAFSPTNFAGNTLAQVQRDSRTWAYPFYLSPQLLRYSSDLFAAAGVPEPTNGWTVSAFIDALRALDNVIEDDQTPLVNRNFGDTYLLMLIATLGGTPIDYRTTPPTLNFTDPATVEAIRQVLDLAKADLLDYSELASGMFVMAMEANAPADAIVSESIGGIGGGRLMVVGGPGGPGGGGDGNSYHLAPYPAGTYTAASYDMGTGYISATAQNPNACYRLFQFLSQHPELFNGMPAMRSQFSNPALMATVGANAVDFYNAFDAVMQNPNTIIIPSPFTGGGETSGMNIIRRWLDKAFDNYVLEDADLLTELTDAQAKAEAFQECAATIPPLNADDPAAYITGLSDCASAIDPEMQQMFSVAISAGG